MNQIQKLTDEQANELALSLLDFCAGNLSVTESKRFFAFVESDLTQEQQHQVFMEAYKLIMK
jgi:hypothetical protein